MNEKHQEFRLRIAEGAKFGAEQMAIALQERGSVPDRCGKVLIGIVVADDEGISVLTNVGDKEDALALFRLASIGPPST